MKDVTHEKLNISLRGVQGMKWVDANYDGKISSVDPVWGWAANDEVFEMRRAA